MSCGEAPDATAALVAVAHSAALPERMEEKTDPPISSLLREDFLKLSSAL
jgi:hypothetical protein